jgi:hypothetical protein
MRWTVAEPRVFVYIGPSLARREVERRLPGAEIRPPVRHGDLARIPARAGDTVLLVDGLFLHSAAVRHKEILALLADGVAVAGSSSMGALRAAELGEYGMRGVGRVYDLYRRGVIDGDDEVAIVHADEEAGLRPLSEPMVNIRLDLDRALAADVLDPAGHARLVSAVKAMPFRERSRPGLDRMAGALLDASSAAALAAWLRAHHLDAKAEDAKLLLALAARRSPRLRPPDGADRAITNQDTMHAAGWWQAFGGRDVGGEWIPHARVAELVMVHDPDFPRRYRAAVLEALARASCDPPSTPAEAEHQCVVEARRRGLLRPDGTLAGPCLDWLAPAERDLPAEEAILRVLARAYGTRPAVRLSLVPSLLPAGATEWYRRAAAVTAAADLALRRRQEDGRGDAGRLRPRPAAVDRFCADLWRCPPEDLVVAAWDRGFADLEHLRRAAGDLAVHARWFRI